jgi:hypothetical protein
MTAPRVEGGRRCTSHHNACDCREAKFAELEEQRDRLIERAQLAEDTAAREHLRAEKAEAECASLRPDAERYRRLRWHEVDCYIATGRLESLDEQIDAAIARGESLAHPGCGAGEVSQPSDGEG